MLRVKTKTQELDIHAGEAVIVKVHKWVQYSTLHEDGALYLVVCLPAFSPNTVKRDYE